MLSVIFENQQHVVHLPATWLKVFADLSPEAVLLVKGDELSESSVLRELEEVEVTFVDDETSDRVHRDFMQIEGATDVITFHHGEIVIGAEVAVRQAAEYDEPLSRELLRYVVHGLLHLAGHHDAEKAERDTMIGIQESIVADLWKKFGDQF